MQSLRSKRFYAVAAMAVLAMMTYPPVSVQGGAIHNAALNGDLKRVQSLLKDNPQLANDIDPSSGQTPLECASLKGHANLVRALFAAGAKMDTDALYDSASRGHYEVVKALLEDGADVRTVFRQSEYDRDGPTALHLAATYGHTKVAKLLIDKGADVNARGDDGMTPLHIAASSNQPAMIKVLVASGARVNDSSGSKHIGAPVVSGGEILDAGTLISSITPLHQAAICDSLEAARALVALGANIHTLAEITDFPRGYPVLRANQTALQMASALGSKKVSAFLRAVEKQPQGKAKGG